jgi:hypothetical protein
LVAPLELVLGGSIQDDCSGTAIWGGIRSRSNIDYSLSLIPFYLLLAMIEDSGILTRVAFMMDSAMHKIGLHGKALIPHDIWATAATCQQSTQPKSWKRGEKRFWQPLQSHSFLVQP